MLRTDTVLILVRSSLIVEVLGGYGAGAPERVIEQRQSSQMDHIEKSDSVSNDWGLPLMHQKKNHSNWEARASRTHSWKRRPLSRH